MQSEKPRARLYHRYPLSSVFLYNGTTVLHFLLLFRFFVIFPKIACLHCSAKHQCPQAGAMGVRDR